MEGAAISGGDHRWSNTAMKLSSRRTEKRVRMEMGVRIGVETVPEDGGESTVGRLQECTISDLSLGGMRAAVLSHQTMARGQRVRVCFDADRSGKPLELSGLVRWQQSIPGSPTHVVGVEFLVPVQEVLERWVAFITEILAEAAPEDVVADTSASTSH